MGTGVLESARIVAFVPTKNAAAARKFYEDQLGLAFVSEDPFALVFESNGTTIRVVSVKDFQPAPFTILGWEAANIEEMVARLSNRGISFKRYPGLPQDDSGIWTAPGGAKVAWFSDPDGNVLSLSQG